MNTRPVTIVRIYIREREDLLERVVKFLHDEAQTAGVTVLRAIEGYAGKHEPHTAFLLDLSLDLPLVIEFFEEPARAEAIIQSLARRFPLPHIVSWPAFGHSHCQD